MGAGKFLELVRIERIRKMEELRAEKEEKLRCIKLFCRDANSIRQELYFRDGKPGVDLEVDENSTLPQIRARHSELLKFILEEIKPLKKWLKVTKSRLFKEGREVAKILNTEFALDEGAPLEHLEIAVGTLRAQRDEKERREQQLAAEPVPSPVGAEEVAATVEARLEVTAEAQIAEPSVFGQSPKFHGALAEISTNMAAAEKRSAAARKAAETRRRNREAAKERAAS